MKHSLETRDKAIELYLSGMSTERAAGELGLKVSTVGTWIREAGIARPQGRRVAPRVDKSLRRPALDDLYSSDDHIAVVAKRHGISASALRNWRQQDEGEDIAFTGQWVRDGLILRSSAA